MATTSLPILCCRVFPNSSAEWLDLCHEELVRNQCTYRWVFVKGVSFWNVCPLTSERIMHSASRCGLVRRSRRPSLSGTIQSRVFTMCERTHVNVMMDMAPGTTSCPECHTQSSVGRHPILRYPRSYVFLKRRRPAPLSQNMDFQKDKKSTPNITAIQPRH